jgi:hypothetical protein
MSALIGGSFAFSIGQVGASALDGFATLVYFVFCSARAAAQPVHCCPGMLYLDETLRDHFGGLALAISLPFRPFGGA